MITVLRLHVQHSWALLRGDYSGALAHMEKIMALDLSRLQAAAGALIAQDKANQAALAAAGGAAEAVVQAQIDAVTAEITAQITPAPAGAAADPAAPAADAATTGVVA